MRLPRLVPLPSTSICAWSASTTTIWVSTASLSKLPSTSAWSRSAKLISNIRLSKRSSSCWHLASSWRVKVIWEQQTVKNSSKTCSVRPQPPTLFSKIKLISKLNIRRMKKHSSSNSKTPTLSNNHKSCSSNSNSHSNTNLLRITRIFRSKTPVSRTTVLIATCPVRSKSFQRMQTRTLRTTRSGSKETRAGATQQTTTIR